MNNKVKPVPDGYGSITPFLIVNDGKGALSFYKEAFNGAELLCLSGPEGKIVHAELQIGDSRIMLADEHPEMGALSPTTIGGTPVNMYLYVENVDITFARAIAAGGKSRREIEDQFYGDRSGTIEDPFGHVWHIATHIEDLTQEEIASRAAQME